MPRVPLLVSLALIGMALAVSAWLYPALPDVIPTHWNIKGEADGFGPKGVAAWLLPTVALGLLGFMGLIPWLSPQGFQVDSHSRAFSVLLVTITALMVFIHLLALAAAMRPGLPVGRAMVAGVMFFLGALGTTFSGIKRNFFIGIRVPWTIASERVWDDTHRLAARIWVGGGFFGATLAAVGLTLPALLLVAPMTLVPIIYSFVRYKQLERLGQL
jgi:uncharacterized membrane protein